MSLDSMLSSGIKFVSKKVMNATVNYEPDTLRLEGNKTKLLIGTTVTAASSIFAGPGLLTLGAAAYSVVKGYQCLMDYRHRNETAHR